MLLKATKVDGIYTADPLVDPAAKRFATFANWSVLNQGPESDGLHGHHLCMDNNLPIIVFDLFQ